MKSPKEMALEKKLLVQLSEHPEARKIAELLSNDEEIQVMQDYPEFRSKNNKNC